MPPTAPYSRAALPSRRGAAAGGRRTQGITSGLPEGLTLAHPRHQGRYHKSRRRTATIARAIQVPLAELLGGREVAPQAGGPATQLGPSRRRISVASVPGS